MYYEVPQFVSVCSLI